MDIFTLKLIKIQIKESLKSVLKKEYFEPIAWIAWIGQT